MPTLDSPRARSSPPPRILNTARNTAVWASEAAFFDAQAVAAAGRVQAGVPRDVLERYRHPTRPWHNKEFRFRLLGDVDGVRILDVGCGMGENAVLLASRGALVTGVDVSAKSIDAARRLANATPLARRPEFVCAPLETAHLEEDSFDVLWGDGVLHHVLHDLDGILARIVRFGREGALVVFSEPVDRVPGMRRLRRLLPVPLDGTPDERPLVEREVALTRRHFPDLQVTAFSFVGRLNRLLLPGGSLERATPGRRVASELLTRADAALLSLPVLSRLGGVLVMVGHVRGPGPTACGQDADAPDTADPGGGLG
jgi:SAM-dependent methyltransferase